MDAFLRGNFVASVPQDRPQPLASEPDGGQRGKRGHEPNQAAVGPTDRLFRTAFQCSGIATALIGTDGRFVSVNDALCHMLGYAEGQFQGRRIEDVAYPADIAVGQQAIEAVRSGAETQVAFEMRYVRKDGAVHWAELHCAVLRESDGRPSGLVMQVQDVTLRRAALAALGESEQQLRLATASAEIGTWSWTPGTSEFRVGANWRRLFGVASDAPISFETWRNALHPDDRDRAVEELNSACRRHIEFSSEYRIVRPDGTTRWMVDRGRAWYDERGAAIGMAGINVDISARKHDEEELQRQEEYLRVTLSSIGDAVLATDSDGNITFLNQAAADLTGWRNEEVLGRPVREVYSTVDDTTDSPATDMVARVLRGGSAVRDGSHIALVTRDGRKTAIEDSASPIRNAAGGVAGIVLVFRDVSEKRRAEEALLESERRVRNKLDSILCPGRDIGDLDLADIIDVPSVQALMDDFYQLTRLPMSISDLEGNLVVGTGWQKICTEFHRLNRETRANCIESDTELTGGIAHNQYRIYRCKNHLWDVATPLVVGGEHVGNIFTGQFFFDDEAVDQTVFRQQALQYGFPEIEYLDAVAAVPRLSRACVETGTRFLMKLGQILSRLSYSNLRLARSLVERENLLTSLRESAERLSEDIAKRQQAEDALRIEGEKLRQVNRVLKAHSRSEQALLLAADEPSYLVEACRIIVEDCGHAMVWVGFAEQDEAKSVRLVAQFGSDDGFLDTLQLTWGDSERGQGPTSTAIRTGSVCACANIQTDPTFQPWRDEAVRREYKSAVALPLIAAGRTLGALTIYSRKPGPFSLGELQLLTALASDFAYGIQSLRLRAAHAHAEAALRESEERLRMAHTAANSGAWEWDPRTDATVWSDELWRVYGLEPHSSEPGFPTWRHLVHPDDVDATERYIREAARNGADMEFEFRLRDENGLERWLLLRGRPLKGADGTVSHYFGIVLDVTERRRAATLGKMAEDLRRNRQERERLRAILESLTEGIVIADKAGNVLSMNPAALRLHGFERPEHIPRRLIDMEALFDFRDVSGQSIPRAKSPLLRVLEGETFTGCEVWVRPKDGGPGWIGSYGGARVRGDGGEPLLAVLTVRDITGERLASEEIRKANASLHQLTGQLLRSQDDERRRIARELHDGTVQVLTALSMNLMLMGQMHGPRSHPEAQRLLEECHALAKQASRELRTLSYLLHPPDLERLGLVSALRSWLDGFSSRTGIILDVELDDPGRLVSEAETALFRIAQESLANVQRHSGSKTAAVRLAATDGEIRLEIEDAGRGFGDAVHLRDGAEPHTIGVGIHGMRERARQLGGSLQIRCSDSGTTVRAVLPREVTT